MAFRSVHADTVWFCGHGGGTGEAYHAHPGGGRPVGGVVVIHHCLGWDEWTAEVVRKFAHHGFASIAPSLYFRLGDGSSAEVVAQASARGALPDVQVVGDVAGAAAFLRGQPTNNGKIGVIGFSSGGRHALLSACRLPELDAVVDCWGGDVVVDDPARLTERTPVAPVELVGDLRCPVLGLFGNEDTNPSPDHVDRLEAALQAAGKTYTFHRYDGPGHAIFAAYRSLSRPEQAVDGWNQVMAFFRQHLNG